MSPFEPTDSAELRLSLESYSSGAASLESAWPNDGRNDDRLLQLSSILSRWKWSNAQSVLVDDGEEQSLKRVLDRATRLKAGFVPKMFGTSRMFTAEHFEHFLLLIYQSGGCIPFSLLPDPVLCRGVSAINQSIRDGSILALGEFARTALYPVAQFTSAGAVVKGLRPIHRVFDYSIVPVFVFLLTQNDHLGGDLPINRLKEGEFHRVKRVAQQRVERRRRPPWPHRK